MVEPAVRLLDDDAVVLRRTGVRFPVELRLTGFNADSLDTWPDVEGRLEWVEGKLLYMPPCAVTQQDVAADVVYVLRKWSETQPDFVIGGNEAGVKLGDDIRAADAAVWNRAEVGPSRGKLRHIPPILAVEVAGQDEDEQVLRDKARWYLERGVAVVWIVLPESRRVIVLRRFIDASGAPRTDHESRHELGERIPEDPALAGLTPNVAELFAQLNR
jgi:Uma2 family endonuclease